MMDRGFITTSMVSDIDAPESKKTNLADHGALLDRGLQPSYFLTNIFGSGLVANSRVAYLLPRKRRPIVEGVVIKVIGDHHGSEPSAQTESSDAARYDFAIKRGTVTQRLHHLGQETDVALHVQDVATPSTCVGLYLPSSEY
jgi:hypothetical protein